MMLSRTAPLVISILAVAACCSCSSKAEKPLAALTASGGPVTGTPAKAEVPRVTQASPPSPVLVGTWRLRAIGGRAVEEVDEAQKEGEFLNRFLTFTADGAVEAYSLFVKTRLPESDVVIPRAAHLDVEPCVIREGKAYLQLPRKQKPLTGDVPASQAERLKLQSESPAVTYEYERLGKDEHLPKVYSHPRVRTTWLSRRVASGEKDPKLLLALANGLDDLGDYPRAIDAYNRAAEGDPSLQEIHWRRGVLLGTDDNPAPDYEKAIADFSYLLKDRPKEVKFLVWRGFCRMRLALTGVKQETTDKKPHPSVIELAFLAKGCPEVQQSDLLKLALADFDAAISLESGHALALANRAAAKLLLDDIDAATDDARLALSAKPLNARANAIMGEICKRRGNTDGASGYFYTAVNQVPTNNAYRALVVSLALERTQNAITAQQFKYFQLTKEFETSEAKFAEQRQYFGWPNAYAVVSDTSRPYTVLGQVVANHDFARLDMMLYRKVDVNCVDFEGRTPLYVACEECVKAGNTAASHYDRARKTVVGVPSKEWQTLKMLLDCGADPNFKAATGKTAYAILREHGENLPGDKREELVACAQKHLAAEIETLISDATEVAKADSADNARLDDKIDSGAFVAVRPNDDRAFLEQYNDMVADAQSREGGKEAVRKIELIHLNAVIQTLRPEAIRISRLAFGDKEEQLEAIRRRFAKLFEMLR